jgi:hypothetical protein
MWLEMRAPNIESMNLAELEALEASLLAEIQTRYIEMENAREDEEYRMI